MLDVVSKLQGTATRLSTDPVQFDSDTGFRFQHCPWGQNSESMSRDQSILSLYVVNKSGGLIFSKDFVEKIARVDLNDSLRLASIWWDCV